MATPVQRAALGVVIAMVLIDNEADISEVRWIRDEVRSHGFLESLSDSEFGDLESSVLAELKEAPSLK